MKNNADIQKYQVYCPLITTFAVCCWSPPEVYFRYDASSSVITSHADQVLGRVTQCDIFRVGKSKGRYLHLQTKILHLCHL